MAPDLFDIPFDAVLLYLTAMPFTVAVATGGIAALLFRVKLWVGLLMGFGVGIINPALGIGGLAAFLWWYRGNVEEDPNFALLLVGAVVCHGLGVVLGCSALVLLLRAMGRTKPTN